MSELILDPNKYEFEAHEIPWLIAEAIEPNAQIEVKGLMRVHQILVNGIPYDNLSVGQQVLSEQDYDLLYSSVWKDLERLKFPLKYRTWELVYRPKLHSFFRPGESKGWRVSGNLDSLYPYEAHLFGLAYEEHTKHVQDALSTGKLRGFYPLTHLCYCQGETLAPEEWRSLLIKKDDVRQYIQSLGTLGIVLGETHPLDQEGVNNEISSSSDQKDSHNPRENIIEHDKTMCLIGIMYSKCYCVSIAERFDIKSLMENLSTKNIPYISDKTLRNKLTEARNLLNKKQSINEVNSSSPTVEVPSNMPLRVCLPEVCDFVEAWEIPWLLFHALYPRSAKNVLYMGRPITTEAFPEGCTELSKKSPKITDVIPLTEEETEFLNEKAWTFSRRIKIPLPIKIWQSYYHTKWSEFHSEPHGHGYNFWSTQAKSHSHLKDRLIIVNDGDANDSLEKRAHFLEVHYNKLKNLIRSGELKLLDGASRVSIGKEDDSPDLNNYLIEKKSNVIRKQDLFEYIQSYCGMELIEPSAETTVENPKDELDGVSNKVLTGKELSTTLNLMRGLLILNFGDKTSVSANTQSLLEDMKSFNLDMSEAEVSSYIRAAYNN